VEGGKGREREKKEEGKRGERGGIASSLFNFWLWACTHFIPINLKQNTELIPV